MSEPQAGLAMSRGKGSQRGGEKSRTLTDMLLVSVWVVGYALILGIFRITKAVENHF